MRIKRGVHLLSGRVLDSSSRGHRFEPHLWHCVVFLSKTLIICLVLDQPEKTRPGMSENLLTGAQIRRKIPLHTRLNGSHVGSI